MKWLKIFLKLKAPKVIFLDKEVYLSLKEKKEIEESKTTIIIPMYLNQTYYYKKYYQKFKEHKKFDISYGHEMNNENCYTVWAEKINFVIQVINKNYFNSSCFLWIDIGYFKNVENMSKYDNFPNSTKCLEDGRIHLLRRRILSKEIIEGLLDLNKYNRIGFESGSSTSGGFIIGQKQYFEAFEKLYLIAINDFYKKGIFIGREENIYTYLIYNYPQIFNYIVIQNYNDNKITILKDIYNK